MFHNQLKNMQNIYRNIVLNTTLTIHLFLILGSGKVASHLAWDIRTATNTFDKLQFDANDKNFPSRFVMTDGGLILFKLDEKM